MDVSVNVFELETRDPFALGTRISQPKVWPSVQLQLSEAGIEGYGEAAPIAEVMSFSPNDVYVALCAARAFIATLNPERDHPLLLSGDPYAQSDLLARMFAAVDYNRGAMCALDLALLDWFAKSQELPAYRLLGQVERPRCASAFTIAIESADRMIEKAAAVSCFPILKVKLGTETELGRDEDLLIMREIRALAPTARLIVDANCAWEPDETIQKAKQLRDLGVEFIEQPLRPDEDNKMASLYTDSALPLVADESVQTPNDVFRLRSRFHGINVKLVKCGGVTPALRMIESARACGMSVQTGCMIESSVCIAAALHLGRADYYDLDGAALTSNDPFEGVTFKNGLIEVSDFPGLGVRPVSEVSEGNLKAKRCAREP